ncbi:MAG TPA: LLM class flavin-dependent oxidoreductase [Candidatus Tectomicrobia bacterium]|jgi:probable F420-dependent oxidoreductase
MARLGLILVARNMVESIALAQQAEAAGLHSVWTGDFFHRNGYVLLSAVATVTQCIGLGTGISYAFMRTPLLNASAAMDIDEISRGRMLLGLGTGTKTMNEAWYSQPFEHPAPKLKECVELIRTAWRCAAGKPLRYQGRFYNVSIPQFARPYAVRERLPIYLAGVNPRMVQTAAEVGDGLVGHPLYSRRYLQEVVHPAVTRGLARHGKPRQEFDLASYIITSVSPDGREARREARYQIAFYSTVRTYDIILHLHGWEAEKHRIREAFKAMDMMAMADAVSDEMVQAIAIAGTPDECRQQLRRFEGLVDLPLLYAPSFGIPDNRIAENNRLILETFGQG